MSFAGVFSAATAFMSSMTPWTASPGLSHRAVALRPMFRQVEIRFLRWPSTEFTSQLRSAGLSRFRFLRSRVMNASLVLRTSCTLALPLSMADSRAFSVAGPSNFLPPLTPSSLPPLPLPPSPLTLWFFESAFGWSLRYCFRASSEACSMAKRSSVLRSCVPTGSVEASRIKDVRCSGSMGSSRESLDLPLP